MISNTKIILGNMSKITGAGVNKAFQNPKHFVLVHGACHGAWSWYKVVTLLRADGYRVTALDMAAAGVHPKQVEELRSFSDYCAPLISFLASLPPDERVVLVGHSMGGVCISFAMESFPQKISVAIFVAAFMPSPHISSHKIFEEGQRHVDSYMDCELSFDNGHEKPPTSILFGSKFLSAKLYQLSHPEDFTLATMLLRPFRFYDEAEWLEGTALSTTNYGAVSRAYIISEKDVLLNEEFQKWMIENTRVDEVKTIHDSDHMVMFSKPKELCFALKDIAENYN